jgi:hypothetical protein
MNPWLLLLILLLVPTISESQTVCFEYASRVMSCDGPRGNTTITPLSPSQGMIRSDRYGMEPYTILPPSSSAPSRRDDSFSSRPIEPLNRLDRLDRSDHSDRHSDPLNDPLLPLLFGE